MIAERKTNRRIFSIIVAFMLVFTTVMVSAGTVDAANAKPKSITLKATAKTVDIKGKVEVSVKSVKPANASKNVIWKSSDKKIATVSSKGVVTGKAPGKVTITATSKANKKVKETINLTVKQMTPTKVVLNKKKANLAEGGDTLKLKASLKPTGVYNKGVTWKSSKPSVAKVSKTGVVTPLKEGTAKITVTTKEKKRTAKCTVTVKPVMDPVIEIAPGISEFTLNLGRFAQLPASEGAAYKSSDEVVAVVNKDGLVTPKAAGEVEITSGSNSWKITVSDASLLNNWVMTGYYKSGLINNTDIGANAATFVWDNDAGRFVAAKKNAGTILGSYVQLTDQDGDKAADVILAVKYEDGAKFWDGETTWIDGAGDTEPYVSDEDGAKIFSAKYRIPMGERLLANWGLGTYSGTTDWSNLEGESVYWKNNNADFYNLTSTDTLTMLTGFKTQLQETGSTCVMNSAASVLEWYGVRGDLNSRDLSSLRGENRAGQVGGTHLDELEQVFVKLGELGLTDKWKMEGWNDLGGANDPYAYMESEWLQNELKQGHPVIVIWNSYGGHGQVIIGYDNMGTEATSDDVLIMMDPYDTTDQNNDGYIIQSFERLQYGLMSWPSLTTGETEVTCTKYLSVWPESGWEWTPVKGKGLANDPNNKLIYVGEDKDINKLNEKLSAKTAKDLKKYYKYYIDNDADWEWVCYDKTAGVGGPLAYDINDWETDYDNSPYYNFFDFYNGEKPTDTLKLLKNYKTIQQSTEWACGCTSALMVMEHFGKNPDNETDMSLSAIRQVAKDEYAGTTVGIVGATYLSGMKEIFAAQNAKSNSKTPEWTYFTMLSLDAPDGDESYIGDYCLQAGTDPEWPGLIPYLLDNNIPMMIGWDEWGGHWQTIIGYDDMGTPAATQDDVLILADSYDTTDHAMDGYVVESFERLVYGWNVQFETMSEFGTGYDYNDFIVAFPTEGNEAVIEALGLKAGANK